MLSIKKIITVLMIVVLATIASVSNACSCGHFTPYSDIENRVDNYDYVISGVAVARKIVVIDEVEYFRHKVKILEAYKGIYQTKTIYIYSNVKGSACGVKFKKGDKFLIYFYTHANVFFTDACTPTKILDYRAKKDILLLSKMNDK